jgi:hypothetical protein
MNAIGKKLLASLPLIAMFAASCACAQERKAYKSVDAAGNVTYSQIPPKDSKDAKKIDIAPAQRGRGGDLPGSTTYVIRQPSYQQYSYGSPAQSAQAAQEQRYAALKAECERNRGTDCNNPATLQYMESTTIPYRRY